jgi:hypothetical protein
MSLLRKGIFPWEGEGYKYLQLLNHTSSENLQVSKDLLNSFLTILESFSFAMLDSITHLNASHLAENHLPLTNNSINEICNLVNNLQFIVPLLTFAPMNLSTLFTSKGIFTTFFSLSSEIR